MDSSQRNIILKYEIMKRKKKTEHQNDDAVGERMNAKLLNVLDLYILFWELVKVQKCTEHTEQDAIYACFFAYSFNSFVGFGIWYSVKDLIASDCCHRHRRHPHLMYDRRHCQ